MNTCRVVVLFSGSGTNLQAIIDNQNDDYQVVGAVTNKYNAGGIKRATAAGVPVTYISHENYEDREEYDWDLAAEVDRYKPDLVVLAGFMRILSHVFTHRYQGRCINIHPSLLPKYKGVRTHQRALENGDKTHGCSIHFVTEELDGGPIILQLSVAVKDIDTAYTLQESVQRAEHMYYYRIVRELAHKRIQLIDGRIVENNPTVGTTGFYYFSDARS